MQIGRDLVLPVLLGGPCRVPIPDGWVRSRVVLPIPQYIPIIVRLACCARSCAETASSLREARVSA